MHALAVPWPFRSFRAPASWTTRFGMFNRCQIDGRELPVRFGGMVAGGVAFLCMLLSVAGVLLVRRIGGAALGGASFRSMGLRSALFAPEARKLLLRPMNAIGARSGVGEGTLFVRLTK